MWVCTDVCLSQKGTIHLERLCKCSRILLLFPSFMNLQPFYVVSESPLAETYKYMCKHSCFVNVDAHNYSPASLSWWTGCVITPLSVELSPVLTNSTGEKPTFKQQLTSFKSLREVLDSTVIALHMCFAHLINIV